MNSLNVPKLRFPGFYGEWQVKKVGELCDSIVPGRNKPTNFEGDIPWITTPDIEHNGIINYSKKGLNISREEAKKIGSKIVPINSIIISCVGELGLSAIAGKEIIINQQLHAFIPNEGIEYRFLLYQLNLKKKYMDKVATKTAVPYMNKDNCNSIPIDFPTLPEQQKIASFLSAVDEKIQQLSRKKELLEQYKKGVMQQLFSGKLRFTDENGNEYPDWEEKKLGEVAEKVGDGLHGTPIYSDESDIYFINGNNLTNGKIEINEKTKKVDYSISKKNDKKLNANTILISLNGTIGNVSKYNNERVMLGKSVGYFNFKENPEFYYHILRTETIQNFFISELTGSTIKNLSLKTLRQTEIPFPCIEEQQKIANFLSGIDGKIEQVNGELVKTQEFKKGLLQQMFV